MLEEEFSINFAEVKRLNPDGGTLEIINLNYPIDTYNLCLTLYMAKEKGYATYECGIWRWVN